MNSFELLTEADFQHEINEMSKEYSQDKIDKLNKLWKQIEENKKKNRRTTTTTKTARALLNKSIYYKNNAFYGQFGIEVAKELTKWGAVWNKSKKSYNLDYDKVPLDVKNVVATMSLQTTQIKNLVDEIAKIKKSSVVVKKKKTLEIVSAMLFSTMSFLHKNLLDKKTAGLIDNLTQEARERVIKSLLGETTEEEKKQQTSYEKDIAERIKKSVETLEYNIKDSTVENTKKMRVKFMEALQTNATNAELENIVKDHIQGTQKRTEFIVKQESRLLLTEYQTEQMIQKKQTKFKWIHRVPYGKNDRDAHIHWFEESNKGRVFDLNNLPINPKTGKQDKPGQDFNCRCRMRMIIESE